MFLHTRYVLYVLVCILYSSVAEHANLTDLNDLNEYFYEVAHFTGFRIDCGTEADPYMVITYGGEARMVYAADAPDNCTATEMAPGIHQIRITDYNDTDCPVVGFGVGTLRTLDVVVQMGQVRQWDDEYKQITCNYGPGGTQQSNRTNTLEDEEPVPVFKSTSDDVDDMVHLYVFNAYDVDPVDTVTLGEYIQLRAYVQSSFDDTQRSIHVYNCRAFSEDMSYYFLKGGCGEGEVVAGDRGFRSRAEDVGNDKVTSVSRSVYFKSFLLPAKDTVTFECDYILCLVDECEEYSCESSPLRAENAPTNRRRRAVPSDLDAPPSSRNMPAVRTRIIQVVPQKEQFIVDSRDLILAPGDGFRSHPKYSRPHLVGESAPAPEVLITEDLDILTIGLIAGLSFLALLLIVTLSCAIAVCHRDLKPYYRVQRSKPLLQHKPVSAC